MDSVDELNTCLVYVFLWFVLCDVFLLSHEVETANQFSRQYELCQTKCSVLEQHSVKVRFRSIIVSSFICSIFIAMHNTSNKNYPNYLLLALCAVYANV